MTPLVLDKKKEYIFFWDTVTDHHHSSYLVSIRYKYAWYSFFQILIQIHLNQYLYMQGEILIWTQPWCNTIFFFRLSGCCKHVAALLIICGNNRACTSTLQSWHQPSKKVKKLIEPAFVSDIPQIQGKTKITRRFNGIYFYSFVQ